MAASGLPALGRVKLSDLLATEGLPSDSYKLSVSTLSQSLAQYSAAIIQFSATDGALLRSGLDSARLYFHQRPFPTGEEIQSDNDSREWCRTSGYYADPQSWQETYDYRPGLTPTHPTNIMEFPPGGLPDIFALLARAVRDVLDAISFFLNLRSSPFAEILDNVPLRSREISSSVLSVCCHARPSFHQAIVFPGLALYQATAGYVNPALHRTEISSMESNMYGRCSLSFKLMPKSMTNLTCSEMRAAGHGVESQFQLPIPVDDFMRRSNSTDQILNKHGFQSFSFPLAIEGSTKPMMKRRKSNSGCKPLPPSKRLRLEAQRVLKERVQDIADKKGIKLRFCNLKECESHVHAVDSPCANIRMEIGWPPGVPFVHPHDLPNKAKIGFLEAYEPGWTATQDLDMSLTESGRGSQHSDQL
ncbi:hypothetical protein LINPERPRIM_LOCUS44481 [Linum perenne]